MKKIFLMTVLMILSTAGKLCAQEKPGWPKSRTESTFNASKYTINHRHIVHFKDGNDLIVELFQTSDYDALKPLDSFVQLFMQDWRYYRDSVQVPPSGNVRIDYFFSPTPGYNALRFKTYEGEGDLYRSVNGKQGRLKMEKDTVRFIFARYSDEPRLKFKRYSPVQMTFVLRSYKDIDTMLQGATLYHVMDSLTAKSKTMPVSKNPYHSRSTIVYWPGKDSTQQLKGLFKGMYGTFRSREQLVFTVRAGASLVRDKLSPMADLIMQYRYPVAFGDDDQTYAVGLSFSPYFFFKQNADGKYSTQVNWFVNGEFGDHNLTKNIGPLTVTSVSLGAGYLLKPDGQIFNGTTMKVFMNFGLKNSVTISPELIATDNFRQVFPAFTVKIF